jgi:predicted Rdx family selenoprotein
MHNVLLFAPRRSAIDTRPETTAKPPIAITYWTQCDWLVPAAWMARESKQRVRDHLAPGRDLGDVDR